MYQFLTSRHCLHIHSPRLLEISVMEYLQFHKKWILSWLFDNDMCTHCLFWVFWFLHKAWSKCVVASSLKGPDSYVCSSMPLSCMQCIISLSFFLYTSLKQLIMYFGGGGGDLPWLQQSSCEKQGMCCFWIP